MLLLGFIFLLNIHFSFSLECLTNCTIGPLSFDQPFHIPFGQCLQRIFKDHCSISLKFNYQEQTYIAHIDSYPVSNDYIYISSGPYLSYTIDYSCSGQTDCVISYAENLYDEMVSRNYNVERIYGQVGLYIKNPSRNEPLRCYDINNEIITCLPDEMCALEYNQNQHEIQSRGCVTTDIARIAFYESDSFTYFDIHCDLNLCNDILTYSQIQTIFINHQLVDQYGRKLLNSGFQPITFSLSSLILLCLVVYFNNFKQT